MVRSPEALSRWHNAGEPAGVSIGIGSWRGGPVAEAVGERLGVVRNPEAQMQRQDAASSSSVNRIDPEGKPSGPP